jgi:hypothetical protein
MNKPVFTNKHLYVIKKRGKYLKCINFTEYDAYVHNFEEPRFRWTSQLDKARQFPNSDSASLFADKILESKIITCDVYLKETE